MQRQIIQTADGSHTVSVPEMNVTYHSIHGAIQESKHVFIEAGLKYWLQNFTGIKTINVLEVGLGTGLNALLTLEETEKNKQSIQYTALELYPLSKEEYSALNYCEEMKRSDLKDIFLSIHESEWEKSISVTQYFSMNKINQSLLKYASAPQFHLIYFDAFAPAAQPELWTVEVFRKLYDFLQPGGILVTYCCKGDVKRAMIAAGFKIEKLPGPPGKREMIRTIK